MTNSNYIVYVIGGGAAGFFAAIAQKEAFPESDVVIIEKSTNVLSKVKISGGGRCNVTHACFEPRDLISFYPRGSKALLGPFHYFGPIDTMHWFETKGVPLKIEADNRVFPVSNSSQSIIDCLMKRCEELGVKVWTGCGVQSIKRIDTGFELTLSNTEIHHVNKVVLATGSNRSGHDLTASLGHTITPLYPSLFTFKVKDKLLHDLSGLSVERATMSVAGIKKQASTGPILITHWGFSGPAAIRLSAWLAVKLAEKNYQATLLINWLADRSCNEVEDIIQTACISARDKHIKSHRLFPEIPQRLWEYLLQKAGLKESIPFKQLNGKDVEKLVKTLTASDFEMVGKSPFKEEFVTCGGVSLKEIDFKRMESRVCPGFFVVGEALDIDGITGGFNFQNAWTTGFLAGQK